MNKYLICLSPISFLLLPEVREALLFTPFLCNTSNVIASSSILITIAIITLQ